MIVTYSGKISNPQKRNRHHALTGLISIKYVRYLNSLFYSLKDTGIRDLANSAGIVIARDQARHSDISTTNKYLKGEALPVHEETKHFEGLF